MLSNLPKVCDESFVSTLSCRLEDDSEQVMYYNMLYYTVI